MARKQKCRSFEEAKKYIHLLKLNSEREWRKYCKSGNKPQDIPTHPEQTYRTEWKGWGDWLGTVTVREMQLRPFTEARAFVHSLGLKNENEWREYRKSSAKPRDIPSHPDSAYKGQWKGMGDWLGTGTIAPGDKIFRPFKEARAFVHTLGLTRWEDWITYCRSGNRPLDIPVNPENTYKADWRGWPDWLGYEPRLWNISRVKELIKDMIEHDILDDMTEDERYHVLLHKGILHLQVMRRCS